jgi:hypothetical protein
VVTVPPPCVVRLQLLLLFANWLAQVALALWKTKALALWVDEALKAFWVLARLALAVALQATSQALWLAHQLGQQDQARRFPSPSLLLVLARLLQLPSCHH